MSQRVTPLRLKPKQLYGSVNYRDFRETSPGKKGIFIYLSPATSIYKIKWVVISRSAFLLLVICNFYCQGAIYENLRCCTNLLILFVSFSFPMMAILAPLVNLWRYPVCADCTSFSLLHSRFNNACVADYKTSHSPLDFLNWLNGLLCMWVPHLQLYHAYSKWGLPYTEGTLYVRFR